MSWLLVCDHPDNGQLKALLLAVLNFTALLIEYSFSRHLYSSIEVGWKISPCTFNYCIDFLDYENDQYSTH